MVGNVFLYLIYSSILIIALFIYALKLVVIPMGSHTSSGPT